MKKAYVAPSVEIVKFDYSAQVVVASGSGETCMSRYINFKDAAGVCSDPSTWHYYD